MSSFALFSRRLKQVVSAVVSSSILATTVLPGYAAAQTCSPANLVNGFSDQCAVRTIGGVPVAYPKFTWTELSSIPYAVPSGGSRVSVEGGPQAVNLANRTALALDLESSSVAQIMTLFPSNVPYVLGRFNPTEGKLRIDVFKLEKTTGNGAPTIRMLSSQFTPEHGEIWKANRNYISPDDFKSGVVAGVNPFASFKGNGDGQFHNISLSGAQVALGHAIRAHGAGLGALAMAETRVSSVTTKSGGVFKKTVRTWVYGHAKPKWFLAVPKDVLRSSSSAVDASFCATDPSLGNCPLYATASAGVSFEEMSGGTLSAFEDTWQIDFMKSSGLTFVGALFLGVLGSFALAGIMTSAGFGAAAGGAASGATVGSFGSAAIGAGVLSPTITLGAAIAFEAAVVAGQMVLLGGANLNSLIAVNAGVLTANVSVLNGLHSQVSLTKYDNAINGRLGSLISGPTNSSMLTGVSQTVYGAGCSAGDSSAGCNNVGSVPKPSAYAESRQFEFVKDGNGQVLRQNSPF